MDAKMWLIIFALSGIFLIGTSYMAIGITQTSPIINASNEKLSEKECQAVLNVYGQDVYDVYVKTYRLC